MYKKISLKFLSRGEAPSNYWGWEHTGFLPKWAGNIVPGRRNPMFFAQSILRKGDKRPGVLFLHKGLDRINTES